MREFSIVGAGRLGTSLAHALVRKGWRLRFVADIDLAAARASRAVVGSGTATTDLRRAARGPGVLFITVPDDAVEAVAKKLSRSPGDWRGRVVFHTSGLLSAEALDALKNRGAATGSLHPVRSFPKKTMPVSHFKDIFWGVQAEGEALKTARAIARSLGGRVHRISASAKPLYHAACSLASNAFVSLEAAAASLLVAAGFGERTARAVLQPLVEGTLQNVKELGWEKALTGPVVRGDAGTVRKHLEALAPFPAHAAVYRSLGLAALELAAKRGLPPARVRALRRLLAGR